MPFTLLQNMPDSVAAAHPNVAAALDSIQNKSPEELLSWVFDGIVAVGSKILAAIVVYFVGRWLIKKLSGFMNRVFVKRSIDVSLSKFILSLVNITLSMILIFSVIGILGIDTTSFLAIFASAGLAIGMALSGTLQNFAGGVLILFLKPFKVGDFIEAQGFSGSVKEISLFSTLLNTPDNKMVIIPNGSLSTGTVNNYSKECVRRVDWVFGVAYGSDYQKVKDVIGSIVNNHPLVISDREKFIALNQLNSSSVDVVVRVWCSSADYWALYFDINEQVYERFNKEGIEFPFPQMDVHLKSEN